MGRVKKYHTIEEKKQAQKAAAHRFYWKHKEEQDAKARKRYWDNKNLPS
jgi:hypothetical protein